MDEQIKEGIKNALMRTNKTTYEIAEIYKVSHEDVLEVMSDLDYSMV